MNGPDPSARDRLLNDLNGTLTPAAASDSGRPSLPPSIPDHDLVRCIGRGSYGEVWLARSVLGIWRAVKIVYRRSFDHERPFERELDGIRRFEPVSRSHPSQLNVLHVGRNEAAGCFYYVMELADAVARTGGEQGSMVNDECCKRRRRSPEPSRCEKDLVPSNPNHCSLIGDYSPRTLRSELRGRGRLPFEECVQIGLALATALEHLHRHGLVHRDIKPSNIVFVGGIPKLADIGLVAAAEATLSVVGTEGYLPPEGPGTPQADIFSLGKVLYEMATGRDRQEYPELPTNLIEMPVAERDQLAELNEVIVKACHADPKQRYASAAELHADLALLQSGKSVSHVRVVERRVRTLARAGTFLTAIAALAGVAFLYQQTQTHKARELARQNRKLAEEKATLANEKTKLAEDLMRIGEEDRQRILRMDIANGARLLEEGDPAAALLWFADALPLVTNEPAEESIHRIRIQQTLEQTPRVLRAFPHESGLNCAAFSPDGRWIMTATKDGNIRVWNAETGTLKWEPKLLPAPVYFGRYTHDGKRLILSSAAEQGTFNGAIPPVSTFSIRDAETGGDVLDYADDAFEGASTRLTGAYFSPDDRWLATAHADGVIRVFDMETGRRTSELRGHSDAVLFISFSADGRFLASASGDRTVRLWRLPDGEPIGKPLEHQWPAVRVLLTDDAQHAITVAWENVGDDGAAEIYVWDTASGERQPEPIKVRDRIALFLAPGSDGPFFVQDRGQNLVRAYALKTGKEAPFEQKINRVRSWDFAKDGSRLVLGLADHSAQVFDTHKGGPLTKPFRHGGGGVNTVQFSPGGLELLTGCEDGNLRLWDLRTRPNEVARARVPGGLAAGFTFRGRQEFGRSGSVFAVKAWGGATAVFNDQLQLVHQFRPERPGTDIASPSRAPNGKFWAITIFDEASGNPVELRLGTVNNEEVQQVELPHPGMVGDVTFTPDSRYVISACDDHRIRFWSTRDGSLERTVAVPGGNEGELTVISPDGRTALWQERGQSPGVPKGLLRFFDLDSGTFIGGVHEVSPTVFYEAFSPSGEYVALMDCLGPVTILESRTGRLISSGIRHPGALAWLHWAPEGRRLLTAGDNDEVQVWDAMGSDPPLRTLRTPGSTPRAVRWSPDGRFIVSNGDDHKVRVWDAATGELVTPPFEHSYFIGSSAIVNSNRLISVGYTDEPLRAWDLTETKLPAELLGEYAKYLSGRRLTATGTLVTLQPEELAELSRSLRQRAPQLFE